MSSVSQPDKVDVQSLVEVHIYLKPHPDYTGLTQEMKDLNFSSSEIYNVLNQIRRGDY